ncbi:MAG TPA: sigma-70 family RNA polymerase sigma factor [Polyangia bacterium]|jgi:RNA polymerase sigma-70 factor (ECF subfamily)|nr:sigma-70 family RNA polymerase sigma factor [Polyangia bacterium]
MKNLDRIDVARGLDAKLPQTSEADSYGDGPGCSEPGTGQALIDQARAGDQEALNRLLASVRPRLLAVALRIMHDRDDAEDVVQESLIKVCRNLTRFEGRSAFTTWLHRIVVNTSLDRLRRPELRRDRVAETEEGETRAEAVSAVNDETPEQLYSQAEAGAVVQGAIARLSPVHREVLSLRELDGESYQEIAAIARIPVGTVMSRLHHARRRLAAELEVAQAA